MGESELAGLLAVGAGVLVFPLPQAARDRVIAKARVRVSSFFMFVHSFFMFEPKGPLLSALRRDKIRLTMDACKIKPHL